MDQKIKRGDIIGVKGEPFRTHKGELTVKANEVILLAPCFHMLPEEDNLKDVEIKYRKRYLDLITNKDAH
jgi:lysyl-tRNA synthetase class 2